jgi:15-cis-phytoene synthase
LKEQGYRQVNLDFALKIVCEADVASDNSQLSAPARLAVAYARHDLRAALTLLLKFDARLCDIVGRASEPMIAQMKLAWWNDAIARQPALRPKGEPVFQALNDIALPQVEAAMVHLLDAWGRLLAADDWDEAILAAFAADRSLGIFGAYADLASGTDDVKAMGEAWALADLQSRFGARVELHAPSKVDLPTKRQLRPLSILAYSVTGTSGAGMMWHALTGR